MLDKAQQQNSGSPTKVITLSPTIKKPNNGARARDEMSLMTDQARCQIILGLVQLSILDQMLPTTAKIKLARPACST